MTTELATVDHAGTLAEQIDYARAVQSAQLLPQAYRGKPADIMIAVGLGQAMGLTAAESLYRIDVIQGKPTASAELIAANVRKAGHRLRVQGDETTCTATIIRADDPEFPFTVTRDLAWAQSMGLTGKDNYKKQPGTMLQWRAITAVARLACPEALYGVAYTADEIADMPRSAAPARSGLAAALAADTPADPAPTYDAEVVEAELLPDDETGELLNTSSSLARQMFALFNECELSDKADRLAYCSDVAQRPIESSSDLTVAEARAVVVSLLADKEARS